METLSHSPKLGHITTFGGNPLIAAASYATLKKFWKAV
jgi:acetylornithine/succinyldiaminopimelate/putrescine aminotransferase